MSYSKPQLWQRFQKYYTEFPTLGLALDLSRMNFPDDFFPSMAPRLRKTFAAMADLERGAIANPDEKRMVGHYWLRNPGLAPSAQIREQIEATITAIKAFAADVHAGNISAPAGPFRNVLLIGIGGVAVLVSRTLNFGGAPIDPAGAAALIVAAISWSVAASLSRKLPLPPSKVMSSGTQMLSGGVLLALAGGALGEFRNFHPASVSRDAWLALLYLIVAGSILGFTAYVWLIHHESPTRVGTYAYVNPVVAVLVGYFLGGEALGPRTILGTLCVLVSVVVITTARAKEPASEQPAPLRPRLTDPEGVEQE